MTAPRHLSWVWLLGCGLILATQASHVTPYSFLKAGYAPDPYAFVHSANASNPAVSASPDPLVQYVWTNIDKSQLQQFYLFPDSVLSRPTFFCTLCMPNVSRILSLFCVQPTCV